MLMAYDQARHRNADKRRNRSGATAVLDVVQKTLDYISQALAKGDKVELRNFGVFEVKVRKARVGRNPNAPETDVPIPQRAVVSFKPGKEMREEVLKLTPEALAAAQAAQAANPSSDSDSDSDSGGKPS